MKRYVGLEIAGARQGKNLRGQAASQGIHLLLIRVISEKARDDLFIRHSGRWNFLWMSLKAVEEQEGCRICHSESFIQRKPLTARPPAAQGSQSLA